MVPTILIAVIALLGFPIGMLIAKLTKEELAEGKKWFKALIFSSIIAIAISVIFATGEILLFLLSSFIFILLLALASLIYPRLTSTRRK